ncbi:hypothetical protein K470DRAFT_218740 [Piedraia hortae CBS 480.64]|uniref:Cytochrome b mRNA-processing protein 4 n=1 Tax=Piedraia hortae CBS 480.64 TaxID=1314780 RepID=A0A6A7BWN8_9PEZI|nr:hypothetical protein K470DRAFT_218740 [Piedraia hortae CBS 480.64]
MRAVTWVKLITAGTVVSVGGPAFVYYITPSEDELLKRYNPDLRRRALAHREERQEDFDKFVTKLKRYSKSDKPVWTVWEEEGRKQQKSKPEES